MSEINATIPFHLARAYAAQSPQSSLQLSPGRRSVLPIAPADAGLRQAPARVPSPVVTRLVAARVPGGIDFTAGVPMPTPGASDGSPLASSQSLAFYRHPADRNAAATSIASAGTRLDTTA